MSASKLSGKTWRYGAAKEICELLLCGSGAVSAAGLDPVEQVETVLLKHRCIHDPIPEENILRCTEGENDV